MGAPKSAPISLSYKVQNDTATESINRMTMQIIPGFPFRRVNMRL